MKNIGLLFRHDLRKATQNVIAVIVLFGVVIIPSFFAWFNVLSSWNPFGNVKNLTVAVANADEGFTSDIFPMPINIGNQVIANLRANSDLNWVFTSEDQAIEGTKAEKYYAALVLPKDFSQQMMTFFAPGAKPAQIDYYTNEKTNALSPKITGQAATEVSTQINETFTQTLNEVGLSVISSLAGSLEQPGTQTTLVRLEAHVNGLATQLQGAATTADMFSTLIGSSMPLVNGAASLVSSSADAFHQSSGQIGTGSGAATSLKSTLDSAMASLSNSFSSSADKYAAFADRVNELYASLDTQSQVAAGALQTLSGEVNAQIQQYKDLLSGLQSIANDPNTDPAVVDALGPAISKVEGAIARQETLQDRLTEAADRIDSGYSDAVASRDEILSLIADAQSAIQGVENTYDDTLRPELEQLSTMLASINSDFSAIGSDLAGVNAALSEGTGSLLGSLSHAQDVTTGIATALRGTADEFDKLAAALQMGTNTGDLTDVTTLIGSNPTILAQTLAEPVGLNTIPVFKMDNFGTQMAPFYTVLGLWVGALLLSVLIRTDVVRKSFVTEKPLTPTQEYLGRFGIYALLAFFQSSLLYVGLIGFVGVRPVHPLLLILAGWVMSFVFSMITYTMVVSFGEAGKAISVFLLVVQISGAGGAYPLTVLPQWFQHISPFLPATHAMTAVRAALAGTYDGDYWISIVLLLMFLVPTLFLGLILRLPLIKFNADLDKALESTKLM